MRNRKLPFGYEMRAGKVCVRKSEAETVQWIFEQYTTGASYKALTDALADRGVPYDEGRAWNKNMVARILTDGRYSGEKDYPIIIGGYMLDAASKHTQARTPAKKKIHGVSSIQQIARCGTCNEPVLRDPNQHGRERWYCPNCKSISTKATDEGLVEKTNDLLCHLAGCPEIIRMSEQSEKSSAGTYRLKNELDREMDRTDYSEDAARALALRLAAAQYAQLGAEDYEAERLRRLFINAEPTDTLNAELLKKAVSAILVYPDGEVSLKLKNGQVIERSADR